MTNDYRKAHQNIHHWLRYKYGSAGKCENKNCSKKSFEFQWSLKHGKTHAKKRENYHQLCKLCHTSYDGMVLYEHRKIDKGYTLIKRVRARSSGRLVRKGFWLDEDLCKKLERDSKKYQLSESAIVREALKAYLK